MSKDNKLIRENFVADVLTILTAARQKAYSAVNFAMVDAYWHIGKRIVDEEQQGKGRADYGTYLIKELAKRLSGQLGKGFSVANLWNFRQFYQTFPSEEMLYTLCRELSWSHLVIPRLSKWVCRTLLLKQLYAVTRMCLVMKL